jgi:acetyl esterase/lipase
MKKFFFLIFYLIVVSFTSAQEIIQIPHKKAVETTWNSDEKTYYSKIWQDEVVTNVSIPTMEVFRPKNPNGTSVIIAPGGGLYALSIKSEGTDVAKWLNEKGITAFVLKYRLVPTDEDGVKELTDDAEINPVRIGKRVEPVLPFAYADGLSAIKYVRENAVDFKIDTKKIGFMGFSAGGSVTMGVAYNYDKTNRPNFLVPVYPWTLVMPVQEAPSDAPPMFVICASDDPLDLAAGSIELYSSWLKANKTIALQMYSKGGHGFGMKKQGLPSDDWIKRFYEWAIAQGIVDRPTE